MRFPPLPWFLFCSVFLGICLVTVSSQCLRDEKQLLLRLKNSLNFSPSVSTKLVTWNQSSNCSSWGGVIWDIAGWVVELDLSSESITGGIENSTIFNLLHLQRLNLANNSFNYSNIPPGFERLKNLTYLNLSNAGFAGQVPVLIAEMNALVTLDLSNVYFQGTPGLRLENPNLGRLLQNLTKLEELHLDGVSILPKGYDWCRALSSSVPNLRVLSLSNSNISGPIDSSLAKLKYLSVVQLSQNNLSTWFLDFFASFQNLTSLSLRSCGLSGTFPSKILQVPTLQNLDLEENDKLQGSLPELPRNGSLQRLVLSFTNFSGRLPESVGELQKLTRLELQKCSFSAEIPGSVTKLYQLEHLDLSYNGFSGRVPPLHMSTNLSYIDLSNNNLIGPISSTRWEALQKLVLINFENNSLNGSIPSSSFTLPLLRKIQLANNHFEGEVVGFPNPGATILDTLDLSANKLEGAIPSSVFMLKRLNILALSNNNFGGSINFDVIRGLENLTSLSLSYNNLTINVNKGNTNSSSFPQINVLKLASCNLRAFPDLRSQSRLAFLDLSHNQIDGNIPNWIWKIGDGTLQHLNLSHNLLRGLQEPYVIPIFINILDLHHNHLPGKIPQLPPSATYVDYSSNHFTSVMPVDVGNNLGFAIFFSLSNNSLTGPIPASFCKTEFLEVLDLSDNGLNGTIPSCLIEQSKTLKVLNLRRNKFRGISSGINQDRCSLKTLNLNGNLLQGKVSKSLANCTALEVLDLGNNRIADTFPCWLKNVSSLRVLVLRSNRFYGGINCGGRNYSWPNLQIIDLASNNFSGVLPPTCFSSWKAMMSKPDMHYLNVEVFQLGRVYYQDTMSITIKGLEMNFVKILTIFTAIDLSNNNFSGPIPEAAGMLTSLYVLNLSSNALTGPIPSSLGNLKQLESLDLSHNKLNGKIPMQLANLSFLSVLNLSYNRLIGPIPNGNQFNSFANTSFKGNEGLCGCPLNTRCRNQIEAPPSSGPASEGMALSADYEFDWQFIIGGLGFGIGAGIVLVPILFWEEGRKWHDRTTKKYLSMISPTIRLLYASYENRRVVPVEFSTFQLTGMIGSFNHYEDGDDEEEEDEDEAEDEAFRGKFCVFCSKLDISRKKIIHNLECRCHEALTSVSSSLSNSFSLQQPSSYNVS